MTEQQLKKYKIALWETSLAAKPIAEIDVLAEDATRAAVLAMRSGSVNHVAVVIVMSSEQQETFWDVLLSSERENVVFTRTAIAPRQTDRPFIWQNEEQER